MSFITDTKLYRYLSIITGLFLYGRILFFLFLEKLILTGIPGLIAALILAAILIGAHLYMLRQVDEYNNTASIISLALLLFGAVVAFRLIRRFIPWFTGEFLPSALDTAGTIIAFVIAIAILWFMLKIALKIVRVVFHVSNKMTNSMSQDIERGVSSMFGSSGRSSSSSKSQGTPIFRAYTDAEMKERWWNEEDARRHEYYARQAKRERDRLNEQSKADWYRNKNR